MQAFDFSHISPPEPDAVFGVSDLFKQDTCSTKVNLVIGAFRDDHGKPWVLPSVRAAKERLARNDSGHEYLPICGDPVFTKAGQKIIFGEEWLSTNGSRVATVQSLSGTGALRLACEFFRWFFPERKVLLPNPTWANHKNICSDAGLVWETYPYYDSTSRGLAFDGLIKSLELAPNGSIVLLHAVAHNPTGVDPTLEQWKAIAKVIMDKNHITFFDCAYQGFASGDLARDATAVRYWAELGQQFFVAQSFAKNFGLYGERVGCLHVVVNEASQVAPVVGQIGRIVRAMYSNPPTFGSNIVKTIVNDPELFEQWKRDLVTMSSRLVGVRQKLYDLLVARKTPGDWTHITKQIGMFTYLGLSVNQVKEIMNDHHVYMLPTARISLAGLNESNLEHVANAIHAVVISEGAKL